MNKETRGGKRLGAGRKPTNKGEKSLKIYATTDETLARIKQETKKSKREIVELAVSRLAKTL